MQSNKSNMKKSLYDDLVFLFRNSSYHPGASGNRRRQRALRRYKRKYELYGRQLRQGSRLVLPTRESFDLVHYFHLKKGHIRGPSFLATVRGTFVVTLAQSLCTDLEGRFIECTSTYSHCHTAGPLRHYSAGQRENICMKVELPIDREIVLKDAMDIEITKCAALLRSIWLDPTMAFAPSFLMFFPRRVKTRVLSRSGSKRSDTVPTAPYTERLTPPAQSLWMTYHT